MAHVTDDDIAAFPSGGFPGFGMTEPWAPLAGIEDTEDAYLVELELPGVDKDQTRSGRRNTPGRSVGSAHRDHRLSVTTAVREPGGVAVAG